MWSAGRIAAATSPEFARSATELSEATFRKLIYVTGGAYLLWHLCGTLLIAGNVGPRIWLVTPFVALCIGGTLWLLPRRLHLAQAFWLAGIIVAIAFSVQLFAQPGIALLYALLPMIAAVTLGLPAAAITEVAIVALAWVLLHGPAGQPVTAFMCLAIGIGGALSGLLGWATSDAFITLAQWSFVSYREAQQRADEALDQRLQLKQTAADLVQANQELARLTDRLNAMRSVAEEARRSQEEFVANVSHELRTPLNMIIGFSAMITQSPRIYGESLPPALLADIASICRNSEHLSRLVDDVLDLSQMEAGRLALSKERVAFAEVVSEAAEIVSPLFQSKGLYLVLNVSPDIGEIYCDRTRIRQVVINLLSNAGRFTEQGGVTVRAWRDAREVVVGVSDSGPGIPVHQQAKLFEPFQQLDGSIRRRYGGSGLGLSISRRFVELHEGRMWLESPATTGDTRAPFAAGGDCGESAPGAATDAGGPGTTIYFTLPMAAAAETPAPGGWQRWYSPEFEYRQRTEPSHAPAPRPAPRFVLLERGQVLQRLFGRYYGDAETVTVRDVDDALRELSRSPAQALVGNTAPGGDTGQLQERLGCLPFGTPAILCSLPDGDHAAQRLGAAEYLVKPVTPQALMAALRGLGKPVKDVLLVDDETELLRMFGRALSAAQPPYRVLRAPGGRRGLALLRQRHPDVLVLDLVMPEMDGFQVLVAKSADPAIRDIPVIVLSATDPAGQPIVSQGLTVVRGGGLSAADVLTCIRDLSRDLAPAAAPVRESSGTCHA